MLDGKLTESNIVLDVLCAFLWLGVVPRSILQLGFCRVSASTFIPNPTFCSLSKLIL